MTNIILISGKAQHGKDTLAGYMKEELENQGKRVLVIHFADYLKYLCRAYFGWDGTKSEEGREILQRVGTDIVRNKRPDFWAKAVEDFIYVFKDEYDFFLIPDTRFENELYLNVSGCMSWAVRVNRINFKSPLSFIQQQHISETNLDDSEFDVLLTVETLEDNKRCAKEIIEKISQVEEKFNERYNTD